jgi:hypothetical protein
MSAGHSVPPEARNNREIDIEYVCKPGNGGRGIRRERGNQGGSYEVRARRGSGVGVARRRLEGGEQKGMNERTRLPECPQS